MFELIIAFWIDNTQHVERFGRFDHVGVCELAAESIVPFVYETSDGPVNWDCVIPKRGKDV